MSLPRVLMAGGAVLVALGLALGERLPEPSALDPAVLRMPEQVDGAGPPFEASAGGVRYVVRPLARYDIAGLLVSRHDAEVWWDYIHRESGDHLNVADFCVVYGSNASRGVYREASFANGQFTCEVRVPGRAWDDFSMQAMSNNHLLTDRPQVARVLRAARVGDQVRLRGWLVAYGPPDRLLRSSSLTRDDTGNGACEALWVEQVDVLSRAGLPWRWLPWPGCVALLAGLLMWLRQPVRVRD